MDPDDSFRNVFYPTREGNGISFVIPSDGTKWLNTGEAVAIACVGEVRTPATAEEATGTKRAQHSQP